MPRGNTVAASFALSAAALLLSGCDKQPKEGESAKESESAKTTTMALPEPESGKVNCMGINECKGQSQCHTASHGCAGQNACKGKGWIQVTRAECDEKGGKVL